MTHHDDFPEPMATNGREHRIGGLAERYRPATWREVVGQDKVVDRLRALAARGGLAGRAYWLAGLSGSGKTTIARLIAAEVADPFLIEELDAAALTVAQLQALECESDEPRRPHDAVRTVRHRDP